MAALLAQQFRLPAALQLQNGELFQLANPHPLLERHRGEVGAFYWTDLAPDIVNSGQEEQGLVSV